MPPRKSTASNPPDEGAEPGPAPTTKASKDKDGLGVEVRDYPEYFSKVVLQILKLFFRISHCPNR